MKMFGTKKQELTGEISGVSWRFPLTSYR